MMQQNQDTVFRPDTFDATVFQVLYSSNDPGGTFVAQTSATPLVQPLTRKRYEQIMAEKQARLDQWNALTPLERLRIELDEFATEYNENLDFSNAGWVEHPMLLAVGLFTRFAALALLLQVLLLQMPEQM